MAKDTKPAEAHDYTPGSKVITELNISVAGLSKGNYVPDNKNPETTMRGGGAATKGTKCRGPMA